LAATRFGRRSERKTRDTESRPVWALVASAKGRGSQTKGVFWNRFRRGGIKKHIGNLYRAMATKKHSAIIFFHPIRKLGEDQVTINILTFFYYFALIEIRFG